MFLAGGGTPEQEAEVWTAAFEGVTRVVYWPFALPDEQALTAAEWLAGGLISLGITAEVSTWPTLEGHQARELGAVDLVFVGGGSTSKLMHHIRRHGFDTVLAAHIRGGGRYYGGSAGALLPCEWVTLAGMVEDDPGAKGLPGLGVLVGASVFPHADSHPPDTSRRLAARLGHDVIALTEASGIRVTGRTIEPLGPEAVRIARPDGSGEALRRPLVLGT